MKTLGIDGCLFYGIKVREEDRKLFESFIPTDGSPKPAVKIEISDPANNVSFTGGCLGLVEIKGGIKEVKS